MSKKRKVNSTNPVKNSIDANSETVCMAILEVYCSIIPLSNKQIEELIDTIRLYEEHNDSVKYNYSIWVRVLNAYASINNLPSFSSTYAQYKWSRKRGLL